MVQIEFNNDYEKRKGDTTHSYELTLPEQTGDSQAIQQAKMDRLARINLEGIAKALAKEHKRETVMITHELQPNGENYTVTATIYLTNGTK